MWLINTMQTTSGVASQVWVLWNQAAVSRERLMKRHETRR